jgi:chromosome segregation ATPase
MSSKSTKSNGAHTTMTEDDIDEMIEATTSFRALLAQHNADVEAIKAATAAVHAARAELAAMGIEHPKELAALEAEHEAKIRTLFNTQRAFEQQIFDAKAELAALNRSTADVAAQLAQAKAAFEKSRTQHQVVEAKIEAFKKDIGGARPAP